MEQERGQVLGPLSGLSKGQESCAPWKQLEEMWVLHPLPRTPEVTSGNTRARYTARVLKPFSSVHPGKVLDWSNTTCQWPVGNKTESSSFLHLPGFIRAFLTPIHTPDHLSFFPCPLAQRTLRCLSRVFDSAVNYLSAVISIKGSKSPGSEKAGTQLSNTINSTKASPLEHSSGKTNVIVINIKAFANKIENILIIILSTSGYFCINWD